MIKDANYLQTYLERVLKDYLGIKENLEKHLLKENIEKIRLDIAEKSSVLSEDDFLDYQFNKMGWLIALQNDLVQFKMQLYFTWTAYKDLVEPPKEIKEVIEKELDKIVFKTTYSIINGELILVDKDLLEAYKKEYVLAQEYNKK